MIYTITLNPSLDYNMELDQLMVGELNRTENESIFPGGKGINVSQVLKRFNVDSKTLGFIGGFTGDYIESFLHALDIPTAFIRVEGDTRINVKLKAESETELNAAGPAITEENMDRLKGKISTFTNDDLVIFSGSIPKLLPDHTYRELVEICQQTGVPFVIDVEGHALKDLLPFQPFLIKPNQHELGDVFGTTIHSYEDAIPYGKELLKAGAQNIIVSLAGSGALFMNKDMIITSTIPKGEVKGSVGAGDSMVAGFLATLKQGKSVEEAFRYSVAAGSATAFSVGLCTAAKTEALLQQVILKKIS